MEILPRKQHTRQNDNVFFSVTLSPWVAFLPCHPEWNEGSRFYLPLYHSIVFLIPSSREYFGTKPNSFFAISASRLILCTSPILGGAYSSFISFPNTFEKTLISSFTDVSKITILHSYLMKGRMRILSSLATIKWSTILLANLERIISNAQTYSFST